MVPFCQVKVSFGAFGLGLSSAVSEMGDTVPYEKRGLNALNFEAYYEAAQSLHIYY